MRMVVMEDQAVEDLERVMDLLQQHPVKVVMGDLMVVMEKTVEAKLVLVELLKQPVVLDRVLQQESLVKLEQICMPEVAEDILVEQLQLVKVELVEGVMEHIVNGIILLIMP